MTQDFYILPIREVNCIMYVNSNFTYVISILKIFM